MTSKTVKVELENSMEARSVAMLVQTAGKYDSAIHLECGGRKMNAKSIMGMIALAIDSGDEVTIFADGPDEEAAAADVEEFLKMK